MGSAKTTLREAWLGTRLCEMHVIRLKHKAVLLPIEQVHRLAQATVTSSFIGLQHPAVAMSASFWYLVIRRLGDRLLIESGANLVIRSRLSL